MVGSTRLGTVQTPGSPAVDLVRAGDQIWAGNEPVPNDSVSLWSDQGYVAWASPADHAVFETMRLRQANGTLPLGPARPEGVLAFVEFLFVAACVWPFILESLSPIFFTPVLSPGRNDSSAGALLSVTISILALVVMALLGRWSGAAQETPYWIAFAPLLTAATRLVGVLAFGAGRSSFYAVVVSLILTSVTPALAATGGGLLGIRWARWSVASGVVVTPDRRRAVQRRRVLLLLMAVVAMVLGWGGMLLVFGASITDGQVTSGAQSVANVGIWMGATLIPSGLLLGVAGLTSSVFSARIYSA